jgi:hypothetical protein
VGYDTHTNAVNGGFDDVAKQHGWTFPASLTNGNWAAMPAALKNLANIQCENCHGPGSEHAFSLGDPDKITVSYSSGDCAQCHEDQPYHFKNLEWNNSRHAIATRYPTGENRAACVRCHSGIGFIDYVNGTNPPRTGYEAVTCSACHNPHVADNPNQLRTLADVKLMNNAIITNGGKGKICMNCHISRRDAVSYVDSSTGSAQFGPHNGPQTDMLFGTNAYTYGKQIPSSSHREVVENSCVTCHLQATGLNDPGHLQVGGHTFRPGWDGGTPNDPSDDIHLVGACVQCHGQIESFDFVRQDYDGDGELEGVQTEVKGLLDRLGNLLPPAGPVVTITASYSRPQLRAAFNYQFVLADGSYGVHNLAYAVGLLKASIADLTGDGNDDGLPDAWQIQYFGSANHPSAAPNATPAGDGLPNWLKFNLGLDPTQAGIALPSGVVWINGKNLVGSTNTVRIYTAAEVAFDTVVGASYQIQGISGLGGTWQDIGSPIAGTGSSVSYVTPARDNAQQFFRVVQTP